MPACLGAGRQKRENSMEYDCQYRTDYGCPCRSWVDKRLVVDGEPIYCTTHRADMLHIDALEKEINDVIEKARRK